MHPLVIRGISKIESQMQQQLAQAYQLFDVRGKGSIDASSLAEAMKILGYHVQKKQVQQMIQVLDQNDKGAISKQQFKKFMTSRLDYRDDSQELRNAYEYYALNTIRKQKIITKDLQKMAEQIGQKNEECEDMIYQADKDQDGALNYQQFLRCIKKTSYY